MNNINFWRLKLNVLFSLTLLLLLRYYCKEIEIAYCDFLGILPTNYNTSKYNSVLLDTYFYKIEKNFFSVHLTMVIKDLQSIQYQGKERI